MAEERLTRRSSPTYVQISVKKGAARFSRRAEINQRGASASTFPLWGRQAGARGYARDVGQQNESARASKQGLIAGALTCARLALQAATQPRLLSSGCGRCFVELPRRPTARKVRGRVSQPRGSDRSVTRTTLAERGKVGCFSYNEKRWLPANCPSDRCAERSCK